MTPLRATRPVLLLLGAAAVIALAAIVGLGALAWGSGRTRREAWTRFSIGPASGQSASIGTNMLHANGISLTLAIATAFEIPTVRIIGPAWIKDTRYAIVAVVDADDAQSFRPTLREELEQRLHLVTHVERRPFDVLALTAAGTPRLDPGTVGPNIRVERNNMQIRGATLGAVASALQGVLGRPVVDETGISGTYDLQFEWGVDRLATVTSVLRERFGLVLTPERRDMDALVIDEIRRDPSLVVLEHAGRAVKWAPAAVRDRLSQLLAIH